MSDEYRRVWLDKDGAVWLDRGNVESAPEYYGPFDEYKVVPADAIVIERSALPRVAKGNGLGLWMDNGDILDLDRDETDQSARRWALNWLVAAEYLAAHPPVDEAAVDALQDALMSLPTSWWGDSGTFPDRSKIAAELIRDGWHKDADRKEGEQS